MSIVSSDRRSGQINKTILVLLLLGLSTVAFAEVQSNLRPVAVARTNGQAPLLLVLSEQGDDPRLFSLNLEMSLNWSSFESRNIEVREVTPPKQNPLLVARSLGIEMSEFAIVLVVPGGSVEFVGQSPTELPAVFEHVDHYLESR